MLDLFHNLGQKCSDFFGLTGTLDDKAAQRRALHPSLFQKNHIHELIPYRFYSPEYLLFENETSFGFAIEIAPLLGADQNTAEEIHLLIKSLYYPGAAIQCLLFADPFVAFLYDDWKRASSKGAAIFKRMAIKKTDFYTNESLSAAPHIAIPPRNFRFVFSYSLPKKKNQLSANVRKLRSFQAKTETVLRRISGGQLLMLDPLRLIHLSIAKIS